MIAVLALLLQAAPGPQEPLRDWSYQRKEVNPRTGREEITAIIGGAEAVPVDLTPRREVVEVRKVRARYFTDPRRPDEESIEVRIEAEKGRMDNGARTLRLRDGVRVLRAVDSARLEAREAVVHFPLKYVCPACDPRREAAAACPGCGARLEEKIEACAGCGLNLKEKPPRCPACAAPLRDKSFTSVEVPGEFSFAGPEGVLRGVGLASDDALRSTRVAREGYLEFAGDPTDAARPPAQRGRPRARVTQLACRGLLAIEESERDGRTLIRAREKVRLDRIDETGTATAQADEAEILVARTPVGPRIREVRARGNVLLDTVSFSGGIGATARGETLDWEHRDLTFWSEDAARVEGAPAVAQFGPHEVRSRRMRFAAPEGRAEFEDEVRARIVPAGAGPSARRVSLASDRLEARAQPRDPTGWEVRELEATGGVVLSGLLPGEGADAGSAQAARFRWDLAAQRGLLEAPRFVRIVQGPNTILAPRVVIEDGGSTVVLKGPKEIRFAQPAAEGGAGEVRATAEGDVVLHSGTGRIRMERSCVLRTREFRVACDRLEAILGEEGKGLQSLRASGAVRAYRPGDGVQLFGDRLAYDPVRKELQLSGRPFAVAEGGRMTSIQERLVFYERLNGKPGEPLRFMEMRRGTGAGIRITLTAEPKK